MGRDGFNSGLEVYNAYLVIIRNLNSKISNSTYAEFHNSNWEVKWEWV